MMVWYQMYEELQRHGIIGLSNDNVDFEKDDDNQEITISEHIKRLFTLTEVSREQKLLLLKLAFMPSIGINAMIFNEFFSLNNNNDLNLLIRNGWVNQTKGDAYTLALHPIITSVVLSLLDDEPQLMEEFNLEVVKTIVNDNASILFTKYAYVYESIAVSYYKYSVRTQLSAEFITQFVEWSYQFGNLELKRDLLEFATGVYEALLSNNQVNANREWSYDTYFSILMDIPDTEIAFVEKLCRERHLICKKAKNYSWSLYWAINLTKTVIGKSWKSVLPVFFIAVADYLKDIFVPEVLRKDQNTVSRAKSLFVRDAELMEAMILAGKIKTFWLRKFLLRFAIWERKVAIKFGHEDMDSVLGQVISEQTDICEARIWLLSSEFLRAQSLLSPIVSKGLLERQTINSFLSHKMLCDIAIKCNDCAVAKQHLQECAVLENQLNLPHDKELESYHFMISEMECSKSEGKVCN